jgi:large subunit ribosomal protein L24
MKIKKGDSVVVIAGDEKGPTVRKVIGVVDGGRKVVIEGVNRAFKHVRRGHPKSPQGGRLQIERSIDASNVKLYCSGCSSPARLGYRFTDDGSKERFCKKCGAANGTVSPAKARYAKS